MTNIRAAGLEQHAEAQPAGPDRFDAIADCVAQRLADAPHVLATALFDEAAGSPLPRGRAGLRRTQVPIIDELGYLPLTGEAASSLFQVINRRYAATGGSVVLTTNRGISQWGEIFDDPVVAAAMLDRLMHRSIIVPVVDESYSMRHHRDHTQHPTKSDHAT